MFLCAFTKSTWAKATLHLTFDWMLMLSCWSRIIREFSRLCLTLSSHLLLSWTWPQILRGFFPTNVYVRRIFHWNLLLFLNLKTVWKITTVNDTAIRFNMPQTDPHPDQLHVKGSEFFLLRSLPKSCLSDTKIPLTWGQALETVAIRPLFTVVYIDYILNSGDETKVTVKFRK